MFARRAKESHRDTIAYEIDMLGFCAEAVTRREHPTQPDLYVYLEAFLLHYRNLVRFLSGENHREDKGDLSTANSVAWSGRELTPDDAAVIQAPARVLDAKYHQQISKYLQHCTRLRHDYDRGWDVQVMLDEISPIITAFERAFPR
jgi:hypothetical protein